MQANTKTQPVNSLEVCVLAAGYGTRLKPLTDLVAKPAVPILGIPAIWYSLHWLRQSSLFNRVHINLGHLSETLDAALTAYNAKCEPLTFIKSYEHPTVLGSAGAFYKFKNDFVNKTILVHNADTICFADIKALLKSHEVYREKARRPIMTLQVKAFNNPIGGSIYTNIDILPSGQVIGLREKRSQGTLFTGTYVIDGALLQGVPSGASEWRAEIFNPALAAQAVFAHVTDSTWYDTGSLDELLATTFSVYDDPSTQQFVKQYVGSRSVNGLPIYYDKHSIDVSTLDLFLSGVSITGPAYLSGDWINHQSKDIKTVGPNFVGLEPPAAALEAPFSGVLANGVYLKTFVTNSK